MFSFAAPRPSRRPSLTPMIDIVFLLLVFFMLASQFGHDRALPLSLGTGGSSYEGPPRLVSIGPDGPALNGAQMKAEALAEALAPLMASPTDTVVLRPTAGSDLQGIADVATALNAAGITRLVVVE